MLTMVKFFKRSGKIVFFERFKERENFKVSPFKKVLDSMFDLELKYEEGLILLVEFIKFTMNSIHGEPKRKNIG